MQVPTICMICHMEAKPAYSCTLCGCICCSLCFLPEKGICKNCQAKAKTKGINHMNHL